MNAIKRSIVKLLITLCLSLSITSAATLSLPTAITVEAASYSKSTIKSVQQKLNKLGYECGTADGIAGSKIRKAIKSYQKKNSFNETGTINKTLLNSLDIKATYASNTNNSKSSSSSSSDKTNSATVYITKTGGKYHGATCRYLRQSKISISLSDAKSRGYDPCSVCAP